MTVAVDYSSSKLKSAVKKLFPKFVEDLKQLVRIPSVSFSGYPVGEVKKSAEAVAELFRKIGLEHVKIIKLKGAHPYVYADWLHAKGAPTILLYAHHDVQPPMREELWHSPPFEPTERQGRLYGRGTADDKAGIVVHTGAIETFLRGWGQLPVNVKLVIEGEEECGSEHLLEFLKKYKSFLKSDLMVLTDCSNFDTGVPSLTTSLRGIVAMECTVSVMKSPLHSGMWGGPIPDPVMALSKMLASLVDEGGDLAIPGIEKGSIPPTLAEKKSFSALPLGTKEFRSQAGILPTTELLQKKGMTLVEQLWRRPSLVINSIEGGNRKTAGNVILDSAWARLSCRIVPGMSGQRVGELIQRHLQKVAPWGVSVAFANTGHCEAWVCPTEKHQAVFSKAREALTEAYGHEMVFIGCGGSIPFVEPFSQALGGIAPLLVGVEDPYTLAHGENESLHLGDFQKTILAEALLFAKLAQQGLGTKPDKSLRG